MRKFLMIVAALAAGATARPWGVEGHRAVAELARANLSPEARAAVSRILGDDDLAAVAVWADEARSAAYHEGPLANDAEAHRFNVDFPHNGSWHYVNLPIGSPYVDGGSFSSNDDVVHAIRRCVAVLEGNPEGPSRIIALRLLIHFVGDIHQPLHAVSGYYDLHDLGAPVLVVDPARVDKSTSDKGANALHMARTGELHHFWDDTLVEELGAGSDYRALARLLSDRKPAGWLTPGDYHAWAAAWASDSSVVAIHAYEGIEFGRATLGSRGDLSRIEIRLPPGYAARSEPVAADQLAKAGLRLAALLNRLQWR